MVKNLPAMWETQVWSLGWEDPLKKGMVTHSNTLAWRIPWTEEPGGPHTVHGVAKSWTWLSDSHTHTNHALIHLNCKSCARLGTHTIQYYKGMQVMGKLLTQLSCSIKVLCCWEYQVPSGLRKVLFTGICNEISCCSHAFRETNSLRRTMQIVECSLLHQWAQGRVSS